MNPLDEWSGADGSALRSDAPAEFPPLVLRIVPDWLMQLDTADPIQALRAAADRILAEPTHDHIVLLEQLVFAMDEDDSLRAATDALLDERGAEISDLLLSGRRGER